MTNPTSNYSFQMPTSTDLVTDLPADFEVFGQAVDTRLKALQPGTTLGDLAYSSATANTNTRLPIGTNGQVLGVVGGVPTWTTDASGMTNPMTTTGDTIYSSSGSTPARLGIGSTGDVLTVSGGVPAWAAPAATAQNFALIGSSTSLSGGTTTISGISGKNQLMIHINQASSSSAGAFLLRFNSDSGGNYTYTYLEKPQTSAVVFAGSTDNNQIEVGAAASASFLNVILSVQGTNATGYKPGTWTSYIASATSNVSASGNFFYKGSSTISSVSLICQAGTFDNGTIAVYGA